LRNFECDDFSHIKQLLSKLGTFNKHNMRVCYTRIKLEIEIEIRLKFEQKAKFIKLEIDFLSSD